MNKHARDMVKIFTGIFSMATLISLVVSSGIVFGLSINWWHLIYMLPIGFILLVFGVLVYLRKTINFPN